MGPYCGPLILDSEASCSVKHTSINSSLDIKLIQCEMANIKHEDNNFEGEERIDEEDMIKRKLGLECGLKKITEQKCFEVRFFGSTVLTGEDVKRIRQAVHKLTGDTLVKGKERSLPKIALRILPDGLHLREKEKKTENVIPIRKLSYGTFLKSDVQLLAFNHHITKTPAKIECFVVWCETEERTREIGLAFYGAVRELHFQSVRENRRESRTDVLEEKQAIRCAEDQTETMACTVGNDNDDERPPDRQVNFELHDDEGKYLSLPDLSDSANESDLRTALEDMLKVVEEEEIKDGLKIEEKQEA